jgi:hypothetical protein
MTDNKLELKEVAYAKAIAKGESGVRVEVNGKVYIHYNNGMVFDESGELPDRDVVKHVFLEVFRGLERQRDDNIARIDRQHKRMGLLISVVITGSIVAAIIWDYLK